MKKALLVIDMQEDFIGADRNKKLFSYDNSLIENVNERIRKAQEVDGDIVIYISQLNKFNMFNKIFVRYALDRTKGVKLSKGLKMVSDYKFFKEKGDAFTNPLLINFLNSKEITDVELVGVDGGGCVGLTAKGAANAGLATSINKECVGTVLVKRAKKLNSELLDLGVKFI